MGITTICRIEIMEVQNNERIQRPAREHSEKSQTKASQGTSSFATKHAKQRARAGNRKPSMSQPRFKSARTHEQGYHFDGKNHEFKSREKTADHQKDHSLQYETPQIRSNKRLSQPNALCSHELRFADVDDRMEGNQERLPPTKRQ